MFEDEEVNRIVSPMSPFRIDSSSAGLSMNTMDYLSLPMQEFMEDEDQLNYKNQSSAMRLNRLVTIGVVCSLLGALVVAVLFYRDETTRHHTNVIGEDDDAPLPVETCYLSPSCRDYGSYAPLVYSPQGFTNLTGWEDRNSFDGCCDICVSVTPTQNPTIAPTIAPTESPTTALRAQYDYLLLDMMWLPQFCRGLSQGHDLTLSHPLGAQCAASFLNNPPRLSIHGLWPNKYDSSLLCCAGDGQSTVPVLDPVQVQSWPIWNGLKYYWFDPTVNSVIEGNTCSVCYLLNHEWQKHGSCFGMTAKPSLQAQAGVDTDSNEFRYFQSGLYLRDLIGDEVDAVSNFAESVIPASSIASLFPQRVNVICDPQDSYPRDPDVKVFSELQTCWTGSSATNFAMIDCPPPFESAFQTACSELIYVPGFAS